MKLDKEQLAYLAGWISSDGSIQCDPKMGRHISFCLKSVDKSVLDLFAEWTNEKTRIHSYPRQLNEVFIDYETAHLNIWDKEMYYWALNNNLKNRLYGSNQIEQKRAIQGFLEGDGHVGFKKNTNQFRLTFTNQSSKILNEVMDHLNKYLEIEPKPLKLRKDGCYQVSYETRVARIIAWYLYYDAKYFLPRKAVVVNKLFNNQTNPLKSYLEVILDKKYPQKLLKHQGGFMFRLYNTKDTRSSAKMVCKGFKLLGINATPLQYGKGKEKYFGVYIPKKYSDLLIYMQGASFVERLPGKIRILNK